jgi:hypothetical protein
VRQVISESLTQGFSAASRRRLGAVAATAIGAFGPTLTASSSTGAETASSNRR